MFNQHRLTCVDSSDEQFTPSFVTDNSESFKVVPSNENGLVNDYELNFENQSPMSQGLLNDIEDNPILNEANESNNNSNTFNRTQYWKNDKQIRHKTKTLDEVIQSLSLSSTMKNQVIHNIATVELVTECLINNLIIFHETLNNVFGEHLENQEFIEWLTGKLSTRHHRFAKYVAKWRENKFSDTRGRQQQLEVKQKVYDTWCQNAINSADARNGRNMASLSRRKFLQQYGAITHSDIVVEEVKNKRGQTYYSANRMIAICTIRSIIEQLSSEGITISYGTAISMRPFFVTHATEKEIALCLCKLCLNTQLLFEPLMVQAKKENDKTTEIKVSTKIKVKQKLKCPSLKLPKRFTQKLIKMVKAIRRLLKKLRGLNTP